MSATLLCPHCSGETIMTIGEDHNTHEWSFCKDVDCDWDEDCLCEICTTLVKEQ